MTFIKAIAFFVLASRTTSRTVRVAAYDVAWHQSDLPPSYCGVACTEWRPAVVTTYAERHGDEALVYVLGKLVMKRWLSTGVSATFHVAPAGISWSHQPLTPAADGTTM